MEVKIFTMTHRKFNVPKEEIYVPLHVGRCNGVDYGYLGDDTGDNISELNKYYGELTGVYWLWKNYYDADIIGVCHYRRYFLNRDGQLMSKEDYIKILQEYDIITSNAVLTEGESYREDYASAHNIKDLLIVGEVIEDKYPEYYPTFLEAINGNVFYYGNLMVTTKSMFDSYAEWLFEILSETALKIDLSSYNIYEQRVFGFLSEQLLRVWVRKNNLKVYEGKVGITAEKAETVEFKLAMKQLVKEHRIREARELFYGFVKCRPDIKLNLSDIKGEIPIMEKVLYIAEEEEKSVVQGLYRYSDNLMKWILHYSRVEKYIGMLLRGDSDREMEIYVIETSVTWIMVDVILNNLEHVENVSKVRSAFADIYNRTGVLNVGEKL